MWQKKGEGSSSHDAFYPIHEVPADALWIDETEVTNRQFQEFVEAIGFRCAMDAE
ncbi:MAG: SUMF1/EgtB/PvdO family nonheme iron enzyme [Verrucomicrobiota bacterium]|nr:SUMF1/EgtB/PvdO family nonheme iron enzyme [Verrucomicrobiota bacterium]